MKQSSSQQPILLTEKEAGKLLGFSIRTLQKWRVYGGGPRFVRASARAIRYQRCDLDEWIQSCLRSSTSDPGSGA